MKTVLREAVGYTAASACALLVDFAVLWTLVNRFGWWYLAAATASFIFGMAIAYVLSVNLVFKYRRVQDRRAEFAGFLLVGGLGLAVNAAVMYALVRLLGLHYLFAKCIAAAFTFVCNFVSRRQLLFVHRHAPAEIRNRELIR